MVGVEDFSAQTPTSHEPSRAAVVAGSVWVALSESDPLTADADTVAGPVLR